MQDLRRLQEQLDQERRKVDVDHFDVTVRELIRMAEEGELIRAPEYQRKFRWGSEDESKLIESLYLGLPVPSIFVATNPDGTWELVDGLQRISTLLHYISNSKDIFKEIDKKESLKLQGLEKLTEFNNKTFGDIPTSMQLAFFKRSIRVTALSDKSDTVARFDLFERLNTGGIALSPQEVRACIFRGSFADFVRELTENSKYKKLIKLQEKRRNDGTSEEIVLKFFAYLLDRENFKGNVKEFLNNYMKKASSEFNNDEGRRVFNETIDILVQSLDGPFLRKNVNVTPLNQLEGVMVGIGELVQQRQRVVVPPKAWIEDDEVVA